MHDVQLAGSDTTVSSIVLGTMTFGTQVDRDEAGIMVGVARDAGVTMFDTSNNYAHGESERILGSVIAGFRDEVVISTKGGSHVDQADAGLAGLSRKALVRAVDDSLQRLGTDRIDVYYLHRPDYDTRFDETLGAMSELVDSGKVLRVGQSNFAAWQVTELNALARERGYPPVLVSQAMYNLVGRRIENEYAAAADYLGLTSIMYNPLAGGLLTGKHQSASPQPGGRFDKQIYRDRYWKPSLLDAAAQLVDIAGRHGLTPVELALRWVVHRPLTNALLLGASSTEQLRTNLAAVDGGPLDDQVLLECDEVWSQLEGAAPQYNR